MSDPLVVLGAGPAGIAAAVEAKRSGADVVLIDPSGVAGGTIAVAHEVRNVPFVGDACSGQRVAEDLAAYAKRWGLTVVADRGEAIRAGDGNVIVETAHGMRIGALGVVVATGAAPVIPDGFGLAGRIVFPWAASAPAAWCGGRSRRVIVLGASDVAFDQSRWLATRGVQVELLCRAARPRAPAWLVEAANREGVRVRTQTILESVAVRGDGAEVLMRDGQGQSAMHVDRVLVAIGRAPRWMVEMEIDTAARSRVRIAGDAVGRRARHVVVALGDGCVAAAELIASARERRA